MEDSSKSIVIVGAGLSGISAAARLMENGFSNIVILEAEDRIGGRVHSIAYQDGKIDLGAQWCHGQKGNIIYETVGKSFSFGTTMFDHVDQTFLLSNGSTPDQKSCRKLTNLAYKILDDEDDDMEEFDGSLGSFLTEKFDKALKTRPAYKSIDPQLVELFREHIEKDINGHYASSSWHDISAKLDAELSDAEGNQYLTWKRKGFVTFFDYITKKAFGAAQYLNVESNVRLNKRVTNINYGSEQVLVETSDGQKLIADHVIFTGSLGVLKKHHKSLFTPSLPQEKITAIEKSGFGAVGKIFLEFDKPFWSLDIKSFVAYAFLWNKTQKAEALSSSREWLFSIAGVFVVDQYPNLLEAFIGGDNMKAFEDISDEKLVSDCKWFFEKFLNRTIPTPKLVSRTRWLTNENFLGAYSFASLNSEKVKVGPRSLAKLVRNGDNVPAVLFAGEATDIKFPSFAHGAVSSGYRAADELVSYYSRK